MVSYDRNQEYAKEGRKSILIAIDEKIITGVLVRRHCNNIVQGGRFSPEIIRQNKRTVTTGSDNSCLSV
jgi:hypothetical protein